MPRVRFASLCLLALGAAVVTAAEERVVAVGQPGMPGAAGRGPVARAPMRAEPVAADRLAGRPYVAGRLIVKVAPAVGASLDAAGGLGATGVAGLDALNRRFAARSLGKLFPGRDARAARLATRFPKRAARRPPGAAAPSLEHVYAIEVSPLLDLETAAREYRKVPGVVWAHPDRRVEAALVPNDPFLGTSGSWGQTWEDLWGLTNVSARAAWDVTRGRPVGGGPPLVVAVTDTGIDPTHPDIAANTWTNPGEVPGNGVDDDANGFVDDVRGWDFVGGDADPVDDHGHGTHVAGTVAAVGDNGLGIVGVAWEAQVMAVKFLDAGGSGTDSGGAAAILYAVDNGADVVNASWGGTGFSPVVADAIAAAHAAGVVFVAAAGNDSSLLGDFYPAGDPNVITVSAFDHTDTIAFFSNYGPAIDVGAPGGGERPPNTFGGDDHRTILSLRSGTASSSAFPPHLTVAGIYTRQAGTSMAAPHVSGAAALVLAAHPGADVEQVRQALRAGADDVDEPGVDPRAGYGRLNVAAAIGFPALLGVRLHEPALDAVVSATVGVTGAITGVPADLAVWVLEYGPTATGPWTPIASGATPAAGALATWDVSAVPDGGYVLRLRAVTPGGTTFEDRVPLVVDNSFITAPAQWDIVGAAGAPVEILGTAAGAGFQGYAVEYRTIGPDLVVGPWTSAGIVLAGPGPVQNGLLATLDPTVLPGPRDVDLRVTVTTAGGVSTGQTDHVVVDVTLRPGWPRHVPGLPDPILRPRHHTRLVDLDGDGTKEILAAFGDLVFAFTADGTDVPGWPQSVATPTEFRFVDGSPSAADLDGDGCLEVVATNRESIFVWDCRGVPKPGWPKSYDFPRSDVTLADVTGDGQPDLVLRLGMQLAVLRYPSGTLVPGFPIAASFQGALAVGDLDGDGLAEIAGVVAANGRQRLHVYGGDGQRTRGFPKRVGADVYIDVAPVMADLNGDGLLDVAAPTDKATKIVAYTGRGRRVRLWPRRLSEHVLEHQLGVFHSVPEPLGVGDVTGDGAAEVFSASDFPDIIRRCTPTACNIAILGPPYDAVDYLNAATRTRPGLPGWPVPFPYPRAIKSHGPGAPAIGDVDGDGQVEVVVGTGICQHWDVPARDDLVRCYTIHAVRRDGSPLPGFPKPTPFPSVDKSNMPAIGDLDGDGLVEIVWLDYGGTMMVWNVPGTPGPERMQWPMARHDAAGTGALR
jgi:subtilisin family serine protease